MTKIPVNSIEIPERYQRLCKDWHSGINCMLYAIASTGGLTIGTTCPYAACADDEDWQEKWYYIIWCSLACDAGHARKSGCLSNHEDCDALLEFEEWVDDQVIRLCQSYRLEDWSW